MTIAPILAILDSWFAAEMMVAGNDRKFCYPVENAASYYHYAPHDLPSDDDRHDGHHGDCHDHDVLDALPSSDFGKAAPQSDNPTGRILY